MEQDTPPIYHPVSLDREYLAAEAYKQYQEKHKKMVSNFSAHQKASTLADFNHHIGYLQESFAIHNPAIFVDYIRWTRVIHISSHFPADYLSSTLEVLNEVLKRELPLDFRAETDSIIKKGIAVLKQAPEELPSYITRENPLQGIAQSYLEALIDADRDKAWTLIAQAVASAVPVQDIYLHVFQPVLRETGRLWQIRQISIAQEHYVTASTQVFISQLHAQILSSGTQTHRKRKVLVAGCVSDELHDVGIRMVADFFEMDGWDTYFIGGNTPAQDMLEAVRDRDADVVAVSSTMVSHIPVVEYLIRSLHADPKTRGVKIIVGGYPFAIAPDLWKQIGADAVAKNADEAISTANRLSPEII
jgi:MerR family transcriptional regulator, light-induced transcriptional regulator